MDPVGCAKPSFPTDLLNLTAVSNLQNMVALPNNIKKVVDDFDLSDGAFVNRLSLTSGRIQIKGKQLDTNILHPKEKETLKATHKMEVWLLGCKSNGDKHLQKLNLVKYENGTYSFEQGWDEVVQEMELKNDDTIDLWSFVEKIDDDKERKNGPPAFIRYFIMAKVN
ncbi:hypothetical protein Pyn_35430 [Prunus yedoensis var. nudiflora]|uniref:B3 domain-containing protein n=1 Tax=Prunus yedoensis var. nudiflora TaxID=2094558 RepID=A0A314XKP5_PRUYE|nr:hypothetical protein Pyn_35430 [Prunus yedoensis var. nudiflora]